MEPHQPGALMENAFPDDNRTVDSTDNASILQLNDDCLKVIFKKLSPLDQLNLALTCRRLTESFFIFSMIEYKTLDFKKIRCLTFGNTPNFLRIIGSQIDNVIYDRWESAVLFPTFLGKFCTNLKTLIIRYVELPTHIVNEILVPNMSITELEFTSTNQNDDCISIISKMPNLKSLSLSGDSSITGRYIKDLINLESLSLYYCPNLESCHFKEICENLKTLRILKFGGCTKLLETAVEHIVKHLNVLETLNITANLHQIQRIAELPKLKHLLLEECQNLPSSLFPELAAHLNNQLETLCVDSNCLRLLEVTHIAELKKLKTLMCPTNTSLNDECLKRLAVLQDLEVINLNECKGFTGKGVLDLIKNCRKLRMIYLLCRVRLGKTFASEVFNLYKNRSMKPLTIWKFMPIYQITLLERSSPFAMLLFDGNSFSENLTNATEIKDKVSDSYDRYFSNIKDPCPFYSTDDVIMRIDVDEDLDYQ